MNADAPSRFFMKSVYYRYFVIPMTNETDRHLNTFWDIVVHRFHKKSRWPECLTFASIRYNMMFMLRFKKSVFSCCTLVSPFENRGFHSEAFICPKLNVWVICCWNISQWTNRQSSRFLCTSLNGRWWCHDFTIGGPSNELIDSSSNRAKTIPLLEMVKGRVLKFPLPNHSLVV